LYPLREENQDKKQKMDMPVMRGVPEKSRKKLFYKYLKN